MIFAISVLIVVSVISGCGQKGPPLPPIIRTPLAPIIKADRRGSEIQLSLTVPSANIDGSRPANIARIDIYAVNGAAAKMTDLEIMKKGTKVASVPVKSPRHPTDAVEKDESADEAEPAVGEGLEQGSASSVAEASASSFACVSSVERYRSGSADTSIPRSSSSPIRVATGSIASI